MTILKVLIADAVGFASTLINRSLDIQFIINEMAKLGNQGSNDFLEGNIDSDHTAIIGYSMGGFGVLNVAGAGYSDQLLKTFGTLAGGSKAIEVRTAQNPQFKNSVDPRIKAVIALAPWGMETGSLGCRRAQRLANTYFFCGRKS